jgi:acetyl esterase
VPDVQQLLAALGAGSLADLRGGLDVMAAQISSQRPVHAVEDAELQLPGRKVPIRRYRPGPGQRPVLMWFHGGGYVSGGLDAIDPTCRELALRADVEVVSVAYRLAPEHRFPAGLDDCLDAARLLRPDAVGGDSAGGGLAAVVAQRLPGLRAQVLLCPWLDGTLGLPSVRAQSSESLSETALQVFVQLYTDDASDPGVSPLHADDLRNAAPAVVVTAERDPLRDDGERYVDRLRAAGVPASLRRWDAEVHGFPGMTAVSPAAREALQWAADALRLALTPHEAVG